LLVIAPAELIALGRINSPKPNPRPVNFERVAVDDAGLPGQIVCERWRGANTYREDQSKRKASERQFERPNPSSAKVLMLCKRICSA
jgi:hypothetical protein